MQPGGIPQQGGMTQPGGQGDGQDGGQGGGGGGDDDEKIEKAKEIPAQELLAWVRKQLGKPYVFGADGHETRLTGKRADSWLARNGYSDAAGDASTPDAPLAPAGGKAGAKPAAGKAGGKQPAKPAARASSGATPPVDDADQDADEPPVDDVDPPARTGRRAFF